MKQIYLHRAKTSNTLEAPSKCLTNPCAPKLRQQTDAPIYIWNRPPLATTTPTTVARPSKRKSRKPALLNAQLWPGWVSWPGCNYICHSNASFTWTSGNVTNPCAFLSTYCTMSSCPGHPQGKIEGKKNGQPAYNSRFIANPIPVKLVLMSRDEHADLPADDLRYAIATEPKESPRQKQPQPTKYGACWRLERL